MYERRSVAEDTLHKFRVNSPADGWFPLLQDLSWCIMKLNLLYVDLCFSPHLKKVFIYALWRSEDPHEMLPVIASTISTLPVSALQYLYFGGRPWAYFKDTFSSVILRCGPPLKSLVSKTPLSEAAIDHFPTSTPGTEGVLHQPTLLQLCHQFSRLSRNLNSKEAQRVNGFPCSNVYGGTFLPSKM